MELLIPSLLSTFVVILVYLIDKKTRFNKLPYMTKQIIIGIIFGAVAAYSSEHGITYIDAIINIRDAAAISAGLIFGAPAGFLAGLIGGLYRWFSVYWGAGYATRLACTISTILAGTVAALLRKYMFDDKKPSWSFGVAIAVVCEVFHMLVIFVTNMHDASWAFEFVRKATAPMVISNAETVALSMLAVMYLSKERLQLKRRDEVAISQTFQRWLFATILLAYLVSSFFTFQFQTGISLKESEQTILQSISDVKKDIQDASDENLLEVTRLVKEGYIDRGVHDNETLTNLLDLYDVSEINVVDSTGIIILSTNSDFIGYNMATGQQSAEFFVLLYGDQEYVQPYRSISFNSSIMRKYAGIALNDGGFIQVGYDKDLFQSDIEKNVLQAAKNRHVGQRGFIAVCDDQLNVLTKEKEITETVDLDTSTFKQGVVYRSDLYDEPYFFAYEYVEGYYIISAMPEAEALFMRDSSVYISIYMQTVVLAALFTLIYFLIKKVVIDNIQKINDTLSEITSGNLNAKVDVRSNAEFASLSNDINKTVATLKEYIKEAAARIDKELEYAKQIQLSALPQEFPKTDKFEIFARMIAAKEVGGDFYDFYMIDDHTTAILVADVSGKGIPAAMFMMKAKAIIKDLTEARLPVDEIVTRANDKLCQNNEQGMFVTAWLGIIDLNTGVLKYVSAGHNPPLLRHDGTFTYLKGKSGFILGGMEGFIYRANEITLSGDDAIFLYTDGVTEATDSHNELYGEERLLSFANAHNNVPVEDFLYKLKDDIDAFVKEAPQFDDITMLMFEYKKERAETMVEKVFPAKDEVLDDVLAFVEGELESMDCPMKTTIAIQVVIEEIFVNIAHYAYEGKEGTARFNVEKDLENRTIRFTVADSGIPFNPLAQEDPDITLSASQREIGGLGIYIVKKTMDEVTYEYKDGENVLSMLKKI